MRCPVLVSVAARPVTVLVARDGAVDRGVGVAAVPGGVGTRRVESTGSGVADALIVEAESTTGTVAVSADDCSRGAQASASATSSTANDERMETPARR